MHRGSKDHLKISTSFLRIMLIGFYHLNLFLLNFGTNECSGSKISWCHSQFETLHWKGLNSSLLIFSPRSLLYKETLCVSNSGPSLKEQHLQALVKGELSELVLYPLVSQIFQPKLDKMPISSFGIFVMCDVCIGWQLEMQIYAYY
jgi:hypothetical protein